MICIHMYIYIKYLYLYTVFKIYCPLIYNYIINKLYSQTLNSLDFANIHIKSLIFNII